MNGTAASCPESREIDGDLRDTNNELLVRRAEVQARDECFDAPLAGVDVKKVENAAYFGCANHRASSSGDDSTSTRSSSAGWIRKSW